jgi:hypothetical protein
VENAAFLQLQQNLLEELAWNLGLVRDLGNHHRLTCRPLGEQEKSTQGVTGLL